MKENTPPKPRFDFWFSMTFHFFTKHLKSSNGRYAHLGTRISRKYTENDKLGERGMSLKNELPRLKGIFQKDVIRCKDMNSGWVWNGVDYLP